ncbi:FapA family protein [Helicobacter sp. WB40]|uniref:FapA family protein n=1 Tax=Helicobacter sp. WB40 TaxID=3004130 RepID=UPI0022EBDB59|nr:FapA family protein [Helicobacter sp. WB40]MDA3967038.1 FapA family protein [Helicobacter sp. WB40]
MFGSETKKGFESYFVNECEDIKIAIKQVASIYSIDSSSLDFRLKEITTYVKNNYDNVVELIPKGEVEFFLLNRDNILDTRYTFIQRYSIDVIKKQTSKKNPFYFQADKVFSQAYVIFESGFVLNDFDSVYDEIRKIKMLNKIIIVNEEEEKKYLLEFLESLNYPLTKEVKYILSCGVNLVPTTNSQIQYKVPKDIKGKFYTLKINDLICVYKKPSQGKPGRNLKGQYIIPDLPDTIHDHTPTIRYDENTIKVVDNPYEILYLAAIGGVLNFKEDYFWIDNAVDTGAVSLKTTGDVIGDIDSGTTINITEADLLKEALGQGSQIQASRVNIQGNVASGAKIRAREANIEGFTHQDSQVSARNINIATHKGLAIGDTIKVDTLEAGIIRGNVVEVNNVYGGKIYANEIKINTLHSNAFLHATKKIEVINMVKGENKFFISAFSSPEKDENYHKLISDRNYAISESKILIKEIKIKTLELKKLDDVAKKTRNSLIQYKNANKKPPSYLLNKFEEYHNMVVSLKERKQKLEILNNLYKTSTAQLSNIDKEIFYSYVEVLSGWVGYNEVRFIFNFPEHKELMVIPHKSNKPKVIYNKEASTLEMIDIN